MRKATGEMEGTPDLRGEIDDAWAAGVRQLCGLEVVGTKHLQGKHDQDAHGNRGGSAGPKESRLSWATKDDLDTSEKAQLKYYLDADSDPLTKAAWEYYENPSADSLSSLIGLVRSRKVTQALSRELMRLDSNLKFDGDGYATLYRGGSPDGVSWTVDKAQAERFAKYQFGGVPVRASGMVGIQAVKRGQDKTRPPVNERRFHRDEIVFSMVNYGEGEVIVNPDSVGATVEGFSESTVKHLQGKHDQDTHGNRGSGTIQYDWNGTDEKMRIVIDSRADAANKELNGIVSSITISPGQSDLHNSAMSFGISGAIALNPGIWETKLSYTEWQRKTDGLFSTNPIDIIRHEGAHILDHTLDENESGWADSKDTAWNQFVAGQDYDSPKISRYAMMNKREMVAESYVMYANGDRNKLVDMGLQKIVDMFDKYTNIYKTQVSTKHLQGRHNQKKHGYRFGKAPTLEQARDLKRHGLLEDFIFRARGGKAVRYSHEQLRREQEAITNARLETAERLVGLRSERDELISKIKADTDHTSTVYREKERIWQQIREMEQSASMRWDSIADDIMALNAKKQAAAARGDDKEVDRYNKKIAILRELQEKSRAEIDGYWYDRNGNEHKSAKSPLYAEYNKAMDAYAADVVKRGETGIDADIVKMQKRVGEIDAEIKTVTEAYAEKTAPLADRVMRANVQRAAGVRQAMIDQEHANIAYNRDLQKRRTEVFNEYVKETNKREMTDDPSERELALAVKIEEMDATWRSVNPKIVEASYVKNGAHINASIDRGGLEHDPAVGVDYFERMVGNNPLLAASYVDIGEMAEGGAEVSGWADSQRAFYVRNKVFLAKQDPYAVVVHELGHHAEEVDPATARQSRTFLDRRTRGDALQKLIDIYPNGAYRDGEETRPDKFMHPYTGKHYPDGATEVLSMGLQSFYTNPLLLAMQDPGLFDYVWAVVRLGGD